MACSVKEEDVEERVKPEKEQGGEQNGGFKLVFEAAPFTSGDVDPDTKTSVVPDDNYSSYTFLWSAKDTVGIYPDAGNQVFFAMSGGAGAGTAEFDGGAWTCKEGHEYRSYFPFVGDIYLDATKIPVSFTGQKQVGNANSDHFQKYDYMYTPAVTKGEGDLTFSYHHLITAVLPWVELPAGHYTGITLSLDEPLFVTEGEYDLTAASPAIDNKAYSNTMHVELDVTFTTPDILKVFIPLAPMNMSGKTLTVTVTDEEDRTYEYTYNPSKQYVAGKIYRLRSAVSFVGIPEAVDMGLSVKWASFNLGSTAPEEYGDYYAWGETEPKTSYIWDTYKWCNGDYNKLTRYCYSTKTNYWDGDGSPDGKLTFADYNYTDDAAKSILGGDWRVPSLEEWEELRNNSTSVWTSNYNNTGVAGRIITSTKAGYTDKSIFLPAAGYMADTDLYDLGGTGRYWMSSLYASPESARATVLSSSGWITSGESLGRCFGLPIRPVNEAIINVTGITLSQASASVNAGSSLSLTATITPDNATEKSVTWSSSNTSIATVDSDGQVTAVAAGTATITATTVDGGFTATCTVTVLNAIDVKYYSCKVYSDHTDIKVYAGNRIDSSTGYGVSTLMKNWASATAVISGTSYSLAATDGDSSIASGGYGSYYWTWAFKNETVRAALLNASNTPVTIIMTDVFGGDYTLNYVENQSSTEWIYPYAYVVPEVIDLGLSVKWASFNLGATAPEEYGDYYAWGETGPKRNFNWSVYQWCNGTYNSLTKYNTNNSYGAVDNKTVLDLEDDAAHIILEGSWRMPTDAEWTELIENCTWTWTTINGVYGRKVTSNKSGYTDRWIFLPAAGYRNGTSLYDVRSWGYYWASSLDTDSPDLSWHAKFNSGDLYKVHQLRCLGKSIRPVTE